jgi:hypothetical protein
LDYLPNLTVALHGIAIGNSQMTGQADGETVAAIVMNFRYWPGAPIEHSAAKQTYANSPIFPSSAFSEYWEPPLPARNGQ